MKITTIRKAKKQKQCISENCKNLKKRRNSAIWQKIGHVCTRLEFVKKTSMSDPVE